MPIEVKNSFNFCATLQSGELLLNFRRELVSEYCYLQKNFPYKPTVRQHVGNYGVPFKCYIFVISEFGFSQPYFPSNLSLSSLNLNSFLQIVIRFIFSHSMSAVMFHSNIFRKNWRIFKQPKMIAELDRGKPIRCF